MLRIIHGNNGFVSDNILCRRGRSAHLRHRALKHVVGKSVHGEVHRLADLDLPDVGLGNIGGDVHFGEVLDNGEQHRRVHGRVHGLAHVHFARDHDAAHGRGDYAVTEVGLGIVQRASLDGDGGLGLVQRRDGGVVVRT